MMGGPMMGGMHPSFGNASGRFFESVWAFPGDIYGETCPNFLIKVPFAPCEICMEASQTDSRYGDRGRQPELSRGVQVPLLIRFQQPSRELDATKGCEVNTVHISAWGHTRDAMCVVKVMRPGTYVASISMPMRYSCHRMIFRTYSSPFEVQVTPLTSARHFISVQASEPLNAIPFSLVGMIQVRNNAERLPQMFDESEGKGRTGSLQVLSEVRRNLRRQTERFLSQHNVDRLDHLAMRAGSMADDAAHGSLAVVAGMHAGGGGPFAHRGNDQGMQVVGSFGGRP